MGSSPLVREIGYYPHLIRCGNESSEVPRPPVTMAASAQELQGRTGLPGLCPGLPGHHTVLVPLFPGALHARPRPRPLTLPHMHPPQCQQHLICPQSPSPAGLLLPLCLPTQALVRDQAGQVSCSWLIQMEKDQDKARSPRSRESHLLEDELGCPSLTWCHCAGSPPQDCPGATSPAAGRSLGR